MCKSSHLNVATKVEKSFKFNDFFYKNKGIRLSKAFCPNDPGTQNYLRFFKSSETSFLNVQTYSEVPCMRGSKLTLAFWTEVFYSSVTPKLLNRQDERMTLEEKIFILDGWVYGRPVRASIYIYLEMMTCVESPEDPIPRISLLQNLTFGIRHHLRGSFMGMKGIQLSEGPSIICTHSTYLQKYTKLLTISRRKKRNVKYRKKYTTITRHQVDFWSAIRPLWLA